MSCCRLDVLDGVWPTLRLKSMCWTTPVRAGFLLLQRAQGPVEHVADGLLPRVVLDVLPARLVRDVEGRPVVVRHVGVVLGGLPVLALADLLSDRCVP